MPQQMKSAKTTNSTRSYVRPLLVAKVTFVAMSTLILTSAVAPAQQADVPPEIVARMAKEKEARHECKVEICTAFAKPAPGAAITCEVTKTWTQQEIMQRLMGGSYAWRYGHTQCSLKLALDRGLIAKATMEAKAAVSFAEHSLICNVDDKDPTKGKAFSVSVMITPAVAFENGQAKSVTLEPVKTEGSTVASAVVTSLMALEKVSGVVNRAATAEINDFMFGKCKVEGVEIARK